MCSGDATIFCHISHSPSLLRDAEMVNRLISVSAMGMRERERAIYSFCASAGIAWNAKMRKQKNP